MHYYHSVNDEKLKRHISLYKKLHRGDFSQSIYDAQLELNERIERVIVSFETGVLELDPSQYALFAKYIAVVSPHQLQRESLFDKLQKLADFDVRAEAKRANLSWFQRTFNIDPDKVPYLSSSKLRKRMHSYCHNARSPLVSRKRYEKNEELAHEAQKYMQSFLDGKVKIKPEDRETFRKFIKVFEYPLYDGCLGQQCLDKLKTLPDEPVVEKKSLRESFSAWISKFKAPKLPKLKMPRLKIKSENQTSSKKYDGYIKAASATVLLAIGGALAYMGFNSNKAKEIVESDNAKDKTETSAKPKSVNNQQEKTSSSIQKEIHWEEAIQKTNFEPVKITPKAANTNLKTESTQNKTVSQPQKKEVAQNKTMSQPQKTETAPQKMSQKTVTPAPQTEQKTVKAVSVIDRKELTASEKNAIIDHHNYVVEMRIGKSGAKKLNEKIETLRDKENTILSLPEDISNAEIAYAFVMYRAYGVNSSLKDALNSKVKLTAEQNQKVLEDIKAVGSVGEGLQKIAEVQHNGKLSNNSCYDNASAKSKRLHAKNLRMLRQIQKAKQKVA